MKKFEKVEKTVFFRAKFFFHCTLSVILGYAPSYSKNIDKLWLNGYSEFLST